MPVNAAVNPYSDEFFGWMHQRSLSSAQLIVPMLLELASITSVVDVGCGDATWLSVFAEAGVRDLIGVDGFDVAEARLQIERSCFLRRDLARPLALGRRFDLAVSLEVAEHLPEERAAAFVGELISLAPIVAFSAAVPGQGGNNHVNEQFQDYWARLFAAYGYRPVDCIRGRVWDSPAVSFWYAQNLVVYCASDVFDSVRAVTANVQGPLAVIHPSLYDRTRAPVSVWRSLRLVTGALGTAARTRLRRPAPWARRQQ